MRAGAGGKDGHNPLVSAKICVLVPNRMNADFQQKTENELLVQKSTFFLRAPLLRKAIASAVSARARENWPFGAPQTLIS